MSLLVLGIVAAMLQVLGYITYGVKVLRRDINPNPASWLMFAYGTSLLIVVEWDRDAGVPLLILPVLCAASSIAVAWYCLRKSRRAWWPEHLLERFSLILDICLTILYFAAWILVTKDVISPESKEYAEILILICWNIGVFTAFFPLLRQVYFHPQSEHALPWAIWTVAYAILACITCLEAGFFSELMLYPLSHLSVHAAVAIHTAYWRRKHHFATL